MLSCLHPQRWKRFTQNELLRQAGAVVESVGEREIQFGTGWTAARHQNMELWSQHKTKYVGNAYDAVADYRFPEFSPLWYLHTSPLVPPWPLLSPIPTAHLPSVLPHRRVRILGRCWVSTVSQLNKTIWKQSGSVNAPAQSDPSAFVAAEKNGLSESRGWTAGRENGGLVMGGPAPSQSTGYPPIHPPRPSFNQGHLTASHSQTFKCTHQRWTSYLPVLQFLHEKDTPLFAFASFFTL